MMDPLQIIVQVPLAVCVCVNCPTPPAPYLPGLINCDNSGPKPVYTASDFVLPQGWISISIAGITGPLCPFDQQTLTPIVSITPQALDAASQAAASVVAPPVTQPVSQPVSSQPTPGP